MTCTLGFGFLKLLLRLELDPVLEICLPLLELLEPLLDLLLLALDRLGLSLLRRDLGPHASQLALEGLHVALIRLELRL